MTIELVSKASGIKSIQRGVVSAGSTAAITTVVMSKSFVSFLGWTSTENLPAYLDEFPKISLSDASTITCACSNPKTAHTVNFEVIEFY